MSILDLMEGAIGRKREREHLAEERLILEFKDHFLSVFGDLEGLPEYLVESMTPVAVITSEPHKWVISRKLDVISVKFAVDYINGDHHSWDELVFSDLGRKEYNQDQLLLLMHALAFD